MESPLYGAPFFLSTKYGFMAAKIIINFELQNFFPCCLYLSLVKKIIRKILKENYYQKIIDDILDKISIHGIQSLTQKELDVLNNSQDVEKLNKILGIYETVANGIEFSVTDIKPEVYGEELRVWCNLQFLNKKLYGFLSGYPFEIGGDGFESYVFSFKNDLSYGMKQEEINIPQLFNLSTYLENSLGFDFWENTTEHDKLYNFFGKIWEDVWIEFYKPLMTKNWFKERGEDY